MLEFIKYLLFRLFTNTLFLDNITSKNIMKDSIFTFKTGLFGKRKYRLSRYLDYDSMITLNTSYLMDAYTYLRKRSRRLGAEKPNKYWRILISHDTIDIAPVYSLFKSDYKEYKDRTDCLVFFIKRDSRVLLDWIGKIISNQDIKDINKIFSDHFLDDVGVDLAAESIEVFSRLNRFDIPIDKLDSAIKNIEDDKGYYIIRKVFDRFYSIYSISRIYEILDEDDNDYIICNYNSMQENIIPPTKYFVSSAA